MTQKSAKTIKYHVQPPGGPSDSGSSESEEEAKKQREDIAPEQFVDEERVSQAYIQRLVAAQQKAEEERLKLNDALALSYMQPSLDLDPVDVSQPPPPDVKYDGDYALALSWEGRRGSSVRNRPINPDPTADDASIALGVSLEEEARASAASGLLLP